MALLSQPCDAAARDHLCRRVHGFLQHFSFLSRGCVRALLACGPTPLPPPHRVSASAQRGRELSSVSQRHLSSSSQTHAPSFPRFIISFMLGAEEGPAVTAQASRRLGHSTRVTAALGSPPPGLMPESMLAGDTAEPQPHSPRSPRPRCSLSVRRPAPACPAAPTSMPRPSQPLG